MRTHPGTSLCFAASSGCSPGIVPRELAARCPTAIGQPAVSPAAVEVGHPARKNYRSFLELVKRLDDAFVGGRAAAAAFDETCDFLPEEVNHRAQRAISRERRVRRQIAALTQSVNSINELIWPCPRWGAQASEPEPSRFLAQFGTIDNKRKPCDILGLRGY